eukprot:scaffold131920_cov72-Phaeocystis_antarctica.AAC.10
MKGVLLDISGRTSRCHFPMDSDRRKTTLPALTLLKTAGRHRATREGQCLSLCHCPRSRTFAWTASAFQVRIVVSQSASEHASARAAAVATQAAFVFGRSIVTACGGHLADVGGQHAQSERNISDELRVPGKAAKFADRQRSSTLGGCIPTLPQTERQTEKRAA